VSDEPGSSRLRTVGSWVEAHLGEVVLLIIGVLIVLIGLSSWRTNKPIGGGVVTTGRIVDQVTKYDDGGNRWEFPVIEFTDRRSQVHRFETELTGTGGKDKVGRAVKVRYDPDDPSRAQWADPPGRWVWRPVVATGVVVLVGDLALATWRMARRRAESTERRGALLLDEDDVEEVSAEDDA
jgi:Protein of unknown function (DUF3592)